MAKGTHFFFTCGGFEYKYLSFSSVSKMFNYCDNYDLYRYYYSYNDNFDITIQALECSFGEKLGLKNDATFLRSCVDLEKDDLPLIYVNNVFSYFNITGKMTFRNLKFSGLNALAKQNSSGTFDISVYPQVYCKLLQEPQLNVETIQLQNQSNCVYELSS